MAALTWVALTRHSMGAVCFLRRPPNSVLAVFIAAALRCLTVLLPAFDRHASGSPLFTARIFRLHFGMPFRHPLTGRLAPANFSVRSPLPNSPAKKRIAAKKHRCSVPKFHLHVAFAFSGGSPADQMAHHSTGLLAAGGHSLGVMGLHSQPVDGEFLHPSGVALYLVFQAASSSAIGALQPMDNGFPQAPSSGPSQSTNVLVIIKEQEILFPVVFTAASIVFLLR